MCGELTAKEAYEPILGDLLYSPYELLMNFIYWKDFEYAGSERICSRWACLFLIEPSSGMRKAFHKMKGVLLITIDAGCKASIRAEVLDKDSRIQRIFQVLSFRKVDGEWFVKDIDLVETQNKNRAHFEIEGAAVGLTLDADFFRTENMKHGVPAIGNKCYKLL